MGERPYIAIRAITRPCQVIASPHTVEQRRLQRRTVRRRKDGLRNAGETDECDKASQRQRRPMVDEYPDGPCGCARRLGEWLRLADGEYRRL